MLLGNAAPPSILEGKYWLQYTPAQIISIIGKYNPVGSALTSKYTGVIMPEAAAKVAIGKWIFYLQKKAFQNSPDGRRAASGVIARDMAAQGAGKFSQADIFNAIQNANAYLLRDMKANTAQQGPESESARRARSAAEYAEEKQNRILEAAAALNPKNFLPSNGLKWLGLGAVGAVGAFVIWKIAKP
jgi:hypothetical protein